MVAEIKIRPAQYGVHGNGELDGLGPFADHDPLYGAEGRERSHLDKDRLVAELPVGIAEQRIGFIGAAVIACICVECASRSVEGDGGEPSGFPA